MPSLAVVKASMPFVPNQRPGTIARASCDAGGLQPSLPRAGRAATEVESENNSLPVHWG